MLRFVASLALFGTLAQSLIATDDIKKWIKEGNKFWDVVHLLSWIALSVAAGLVAADAFGRFGVEL